MNDFIEDVLMNAANGAGRYTKIDETTRETAQKLYEEFLNNSFNVSGNVFGVDIQSGVVRVSRWER